MTTQDLYDRLKATFGDDVGPLAEPRVDPFCVVKAARIVEVCRYAKRELGCDFLEDLTAVDWPKRSVIEIVYHLFSYRHRAGLVLKVEADRAAPRVATVEGVWKAANWFEREVYDLFGVEFEGHPDLRRIMLPDDWVGHPLRKDYAEAGGYQGIGNTREDPLVELKRLDDRSRAEAVARASTGSARAEDLAARPELVEGRAPSPATPAPEKA